jgi:uncharacterized protein
MGMHASLQIVIPGGTGQLGGILAGYFSIRGDRVTILTRGPDRSRVAAAPPARGEAGTAGRTLLWDGETIGDWAESLEGVDVLINLAGRSVNCRYNTNNKSEILQSRLRSTRVLGQSIRRLAHPPKLWINASTATIYRHSFDRAMDEASGEIGGKEADAPPSWRFSTDVATQWEESFFGVRTPRTRKIALRGGMVLSPTSGGTLDLLLRLVRFGLGGAAGQGDQFVSWIHNLDFATAVDYLIGHEELQGAVNVTSPLPLPNREFMRVLREASGIPLGLPVSERMLRLGSFFLRTESELLLKSRRVIPGRLLEHGFQFKFPDWPSAARDLVLKGNGKSLAANSREGGRSGLEELHEPTN